jgi:hypothetical protein
VNQQLVVPLSLRRGSAVIRPIRLVTGMKSGGGPGKVHRGDLGFWWSGSGRPVELSADPTDLALGDARADSEGPDQDIDLAGAHAMHVGLHHHREQRPVDPPSPFQLRREEAATAELGDLQLNITSRRGRQPGPVPVALVRTGVGSRPPREFVSRAMQIAQPGQRGLSGNKGVCREICD